MATSKACMNMLCGTTCMSTDCKHGWSLRSGGFATLCDNCGSLYEQLIFCDVFHSKDSGWRECVSCGKRLHCGCVASQLLFELVDTGGVSCKNCARSQIIQSRASNEEQKGLGATKVDDSEQMPILMNNQLDGSSAATVRHMPIGSNAGSTLLRQLLPSQSDDTSGSFRQIKQEEFMPSVGEIGGSCFSNANQSSNTSPIPAKLNIGADVMYDSLASANLSFTLGISNSLAAAGSDEREHGKASSALQGSRGRHLLPKPPRSTLTNLDASASLGPRLRMARPPAEGRGRYQLLPRYWPRITDQELQQLSGDSNSTIVPLFEKVLSASDAGRIGRLVLPKACAEAYFPPICQPEGLPLRIQDVKGKEWVFQFRFWPNNNSRMYVLEGVTPCIQSMQLQAGDTVTFSRMDPEGKLVMGFRKASSSVVMQENQQPALSNGSPSSETFFSGVIQNLPILNGYSGLLQSLKGSTETHIGTLSKHLSSAADVIWPSNERRDENKELLQSIMTPDRKRARNIGSKSKRLVIDSEDALELKFTWEEAQDLLRPPPCAKPSIVLVEDHEFEEYEEPPVFAKRSVFLLRPNGVQEQWVQCDCCSKWRRLPVDVLLPRKWTCTDNIWDHSRSSCSEPNELTPREVENLVRLNTEFRKLRMTKQTQEHESSGLDALANAVITEDNTGEGDPGTPSVAATTKHPRHRPGCSCIVCIQPPSGKGKHKPTCTCNVCMTVKRRFKTLMMRKKKRQSEREAELAQKNQNTWGLKDESEVESSSRHALSQTDPSDNDIRMASEPESKNQNIPSDNLAETSMGQIDLNLNCHPNREEDLHVGLNVVNMTSLLREASLPLETYMKQNALASLVSEQTSSTSHLPLQVTGESEGQTHEEPCLPLTIQECENGEENCLPDQRLADP